MLDRQRLDHGPVPRHASTRDVRRSSSEPALARRIVPDAEEAERATRPISLTPTLGDQVCAGQSGRVRRLPQLPAPASAPPAGLIRRYPVKFRADNGTTVDKDTTTMTYEDLSKVLDPTNGYGAEEV